MPVHAEESLSVDTHEIAKEHHLGIHYFIYCSCGKAFHNRRKERTQVLYENHLEQVFAPYQRRKIV